MDEIELRVAALELLVIELGAWLPREALLDAARSIQAGLTAAPDPDEAAVRQQALQLIEDAVNRFGGRVMD